LNNCVKANWINRWVISRENADVIGLKGSPCFDKPVDQWGACPNLMVSDRLKFNIMEEWKKFKFQFYRVGANIGNACLFDNDGILMGKRNLGLHIFGQQRYDELNGEKKILPVKIFCNNGYVKTKLELEVILEQQINMAEYFRFRNTVSEIRRVYGANFEGGKCLDAFMRGRRRKGGELRKHIGNFMSPEHLRNDPRRVPSAITLWGNHLENVNRWLIELNFGLWGISKLGAEFRMFIFNFLQGRLYLNNVLARIDQTSPICTFCNIRGRKELSDRGILEDRPEFEYYLRLLPTETVNHLFWECEHSQVVIQRCYRWIRGFDWYNGNNVIDQKSFFVGLENHNRKVVRVDLLWKQFTRFYLYRCRYRRKIPHFPSLKFELEGLFQNTGMRVFLLDILNINLIYG